MMELKEVIVIVNETIEGYGYAVDFPILVNKRFKTCNGRVTEQATNGVYKPVKMEFSAAMLASATPESIRQVVLHECAHALVTLTTGENHGHDAAFKAMCHKIGCILDKATSDLEYDNQEAKEVIHAVTYKWEVRCACCGKSIGRYQRAGKVVKNPELFYSKCCNAGIVIKNL